MLPFGTNVLQVGDSANFLAGASAPTAGVAAPIGSFYCQSGGSVVWQKVGASDTAWVSLSPAGYAGPDDYIDGDVVIGADTALTRDMYYRDLTVGAAFTLDCRGWRINARTIVCDGKISNEGNAAFDNTGGPAISVGSWGAAGAVGHSTAGANPGNNVPGNANSVHGLVVTTGIGGSGGAGGTGAVAPGGAGGGVTYVVTNQEQSHMRDFITAGMGKGRNNLSVFDYVQFGSGGGAGGGSGPGVNPAGGGGAGGGGGGGLWVAAEKVTGSGLFSVRGGNGSNSVHAARGGGGGGGGGIIVLYTHYCSILLDVSGGDGGAAEGSGLSVKGSPGGNGTLLKFAM